MLSRVPGSGDNTRNGYLTPAFLGPRRAQNCYLIPCYWGYQNQGTKSEQPTTPFSGARKSAGLLDNPYVLGGPQNRGQNQNKLRQPSQGGPKRAGLLDNPCVPGGPRKRGQLQNWLPHPCLLGGHKRAELLHKPCVLGGPQEGTKSERATSPFSGARRRAALLDNPCVLARPKKRGQNHNCPERGLRVSWTARSNHSHFL